MVGWKLANSFVMENDDTLLPSYNRKKGIYGCFACGIGVYLAVHKDKDIFYSAVTTHIHPNEGKEDGEIHYKRDSPILSYFVFPDLGYAVAMRSGDVVVFNSAKHPHALSTNTKHRKCYNVALFTKTRAASLNNKDIPLKTSAVEMAKTLGVE